MKIFLSVLFSLIISVSHLYAETEIKNTLRHKRGNSLYILYTGEVSLPVKGTWNIKEVKNKGFEHEIYLSSTRSTIHTRRETEVNSFKNNQSNKKDTIDQSSAGKNIGPDQQKTLNQYIITTLLPADEPGPLNLVVFNPITNNEILIQWDIEKADIAGQSKDDKLNRARIREWIPYLAHSPASPTMRSWLQLSSPKTTNQTGRSQRDLRQGRQLSVFSCLGGRAAVEETLQLQELEEPVSQKEGQTVPVNTIKGVEVASHPYEKMVSDLKSLKMPLAQFSPYDHFFVYTPKPEAIIPFLNEGADFISDIGGISQESNISYKLKDKYLRRLGLNNNLLKMIIKSGAIKEAAFIFPDLFFIDGTDVTVVSRLTSKGLLGSIIKLVGVKGLNEDNIVKRVLPDKQQVFWALREDLLIISTNNSEMNKVLTLHRNQGADSLGKSTEFRYMLSQLNISDTTRFYTYFSDPFIRKLVSPETKIAQRRRLIAKRDLERITAGALLAKLDGHPPPVSIHSLVSDGYIPERVNNNQFSITTDLLASSREYGSIGNLTTLPEIPVDNVTPAESAAYKQYVDNYNRYWRRYFDPIAIRIDDLESGELEASVFILPLIESTIYRVLQDIIATNEDKTVLKVPDTSPQPITMLSLNIKKNNWSRIAREYQSLFSRYTHINPSFINDLGPGVHLAVQDADPVIALGSGDILGAFSSDIAGLFRGGGAILIPASLSILTRPCTLYIETADPEQTKKYLQQATSIVSRPADRFDDPVIDFYQISGRDEWIYSFDLFGLVKLRFGVEIQGGYLVIRNIPWFPRESIKEVKKAELNGAKLTVYPDAGKLQLSGLFTSAHEQYRKTAKEGMAYLYPLLISRQANINQAAEEHLRLYGFQPVHPEGGHWTWSNGKLSSSIYGSASKQEQPSYSQIDGQFGLFKNIHSFSLNMQFEDTGLRSQIRWKTKSQ